MYRVPGLVSSCHCKDSNKEEDHQLSNVGKHMGTLSDGHTRRLTYVLLDVILHRNAAECNSEDARHMEGLCCQVREICEYQDNQWL